MSGQLPPPRRRRIAGERRPAPTAQSATPATPEPQATPATPAPQAAPDEQAPVDLTKPAKPTEPTKRTKVRRPRPQPTGDGWWGSTATVVVLAVALVVILALTGLGLAGLLGNRGIPQIREAAQVTDAEETAPSVAERAAEAILAYDYKTLDADQDAAERFMTPAFVKKYSDSFTKAVAPAARTFKARVTTEVLASSVVRATPDHVRVLVFVDQTTVATNKKNPQVALNRVELSMVLRGGSWLVDDIGSY
ncbi:hypothetical protein [Nocardioides marmoribigeumensis]|uniref:Mce-associated membrane protein n=1 Tax=Nocardioides marmoribigeumensis TaxID=433649 RepID=A0ABU2BWU9_9ACTN|nr:hypothetical protein [Nocardioides marmoribigeumensis]MDR7362924.1 Mce-associated membrane protein [Nocardioides marmoribigeumensis]